MFLSLSPQLRVERLAEEKAKRKVATKRQEELELRKKQEEAARQKKLLQAVSQPQQSKWGVHVEKKLQV